MKKNDIALLILIASVALVATYFITQAIVGKPEERSVQVETAEPISTEVAEPDPRTFNNQAINPTVEINIGNSANRQPF